jgi:hypothetical protein
MFRTITLWIVLIAPALTLAQEPSPVPSPAPPDLSTCSADDLFSDECRAASDAESQWLKDDKTLRPRLAGLKPCSKETQQAIQQVRDESAETIARKGQYHNKWRGYLQEQQGRHGKFSADMATFREELQRMARADEERLKELEGRKRELKQSAKASGASAEEALKQLDELISSARDSLDNVRRSFAKADEAEQAENGSDKLRRALIESIEQEQRFLATESTLWEAYYQAVEQTEGFHCLQRNKNSIKHWPRHLPTDGEDAGTAGDAQTTAKAPPDGQKD